MTIVEDGIAYRVDVVHGQKTGFYLDQRDNRAHRARHAAGRRVLNAFCYTGGFSLAALAGGAASVRFHRQFRPTRWTSRATISRAMRRSMPRARNGARPTCSRSCAGCATRARAFDMIVLDPPKFAPTAAHAERAARAYKDINLLAFKLLAPGGLLATFSCSGGISAELFQKIVAGAALDAQCRRRRSSDTCTASGDHPVALNFPEGDYLKGLLIRRA